MGITDDFIQSAIRGAEIEGGKPVALAGNDPLSGRSRSGESWTEEEDEFLRKHNGRLSEDEIAARLGRSVIGTHIRRERELHLHSPIKDPDYITGYRLARKLGMNEARKITTWIKAGILAGEMVPFRDHDVTRIKKAIVLEWVVKPESWLYFHPERVRDPNLKMIVDEAVKAWGDEWWSTRRATDYWSLPDISDIKRAIQLGRVKTAVQVFNLSGRYPTPRWSYWFIRRSEVVSWNLQDVLRFRKDKR